jgi:hypothetical protein
MQLGDNYMANMRKYIDIINENHPDPLDHFKQSNADSIDAFDAQAKLGKYADDTSPVVTAPVVTAPVVNDKVEYYKINPQNAKPIPGYIDVDGWMVKGSERDAAMFKQQLDDLAGSLGLSSARALTYNMNPILNKSIGKLKGVGGDALHGSMKPSANGEKPDIHTLSYSGDTYKNNYDKFVNTFAHEIGHSLAYRLSRVNIDGDLESPITASIRNTGNGGNLFGIDKGILLTQMSTVDDMTPLNLAIAQTSPAFRSKIFARIMDSDLNRQRPALKQSIADAVSHMITDRKMVAAADKDVNDNLWLDQNGSMGSGNMFYRKDPHEYWARAIAEFSMLKRIAPLNRFSPEQTSKNKITQETFNKIQTMFDTMKVVNGHTLAKADLPKGPERMV